MVSGLPTIAGKDTFRVIAGRVESEVKQFKQRLTASGMRWSHPGAARMIPIRAVGLDGSFDQRWSQSRLTCNKSKCTRFVLLPRRWVIERSFSWMARFRRLARDDERLPQTLAGLHDLAFAILMLARFVHLVLQTTVPDFNC